MTLKDTLQEYISGEIDAVETIRTLTSIFNPDIAADLLVLINQITRLEQGDMDHDVFIEMHGLEDK